MGHPFLIRLLVVLYRHVAALSWPVLVLLVFVHLATSWAAFILAGEDKAAELDSFWYYYAVTATTIGYGDIAPVTVPGRVVAVFWLMPGGIALFTAVITKLVQSAAKVWNRRMRGDGDYSEMTDHLVIMGWHPTRTPKLVHLLLADHRYDHVGIVLVAPGLERNPMPDHARFIRVDGLPSQDGNARSGAARAEAVVAMGASDNETLAMGLAVGALDPTPRIVAHFEDESVAHLLRCHCPSAECSVSLSVEMLARSAQDPGSSEVQRQIVSPIDSPTQYGLVVPSDAPAFTYGRGLSFFKARYDATVIAMRRVGHAIEVNAKIETPVQSGDCLYYIAPQRVRAEEIDWTACAEAVPG
jgi:voltage-gated potassium channel